MKPTDRLITGIIPCFCPTFCYLNAVYVDATTKILFQTAPIKSWIKNKK